MSFAAPAASAVGSVLSNPTTWKAISAGAGLLSAFGAKKEGEQQQAAYDTNAAVYQESAAANRTAAELNAYKRRKQLHGIIGAQTAMYGARGVSPISGSPIDVMTEDLANGYLDIAIDSYNYEIAARQDEYRADIQRYYGRQAESTGSTTSKMNLLKTVADFGLSMTKAKIGAGK